MSRLAKSFDIIGFLKHYEEYPCLWDKKDHDFRNRLKRGAAEEKLLPISGLSSIKDLRARIRSIRGTYNQEITKINKSVMSGVTAEDVYRPKLTWFSYADNFLRKNFEDEVKTDSNFTLISSCTSGYDDASELFEDTLSNEEHSVASEQLQEQQHMLPTPRQTFTKRTVMKPNANKVQKIDNPFGEVVQTFRDIANPQDVSNEFRIFGEHVATQMAQLPLEDALQLQEEFQKMLTAARLRSIRNKSVTQLEYVVENSEDSITDRAENEAKLNNNKTKPSVHSMPYYDNEIVSLLQDSEHDSFTYKSDSKQKNELEIGNFSTVSTPSNRLPVENEIYQKKTGKKNMLVHSFLPGGKKVKIERVEDSAGYVNKTVSGQSSPHRSNVTFGYNKNGFDIEVEHETGARGNVMPSYEVYIKHEDVDEEFLESEDPIQINLL